MSPRNAVYDFRQLHNQSYDSDAVQSAIAHVPYTIANRDNKPLIQVEILGETREFTPEAIVALVLGEIKQWPQAYLGYEVLDGVVTVPASFRDGQRQAVKDAGGISGLFVLRTVSEATAAAIAHGIDKKKIHIETIALVLHLDQGTFSATVFAVEDGVFEVLATGGDTKDLNGDVFVECLVTETEARVDLEWSTDDNSDVILSTAVSRARFEHMTKDLVECMLSEVDKVLEQANVTRAEVEEVVLVGAFSRMPMVQQSVQAFFAGKEPSHRVDEDEAILLGAVAQAAFLEADHPEVYYNPLPIVLLPLGVETAGGIMHPVVRLYTTYPVQKKEIVSTLCADQTTAAIRTYEGSRVFTRDNRWLGQLELSGLEPTPHGASQIELIFEINYTYEEVLVIARDVATGMARNVTVSLQHHAFLSVKMLETMTSEAEAAYEADVKVKERIAQWLGGRWAEVPTQDDPALEVSRRALVEATDAIVAVETVAVDHAGGVS